ncbi:hypothetical protein CcrC1_gp261c [Caulobacter phage C1]|nr:hypothetical protein CcrC1_gp261c [Caulobacter phage C1]UTU08490.1 hypothetical protein CcrC2_gp262c [Caulobacter phage C2]UTU09005.1 hypothetical protein CcrJ4_gp256c [Caulobacter phage J4]UTU09566.1 hypothetical protein CcrBL47_gp280c [Caulobacter phage BL47]UTU10123.1 hypothetical protein CcrRB23_gp261c [Caulobacter phage RB23]WGN97158.1 hypothetical protein [Bertelyvirus sp.]
MAKLKVYHITYYHPAIPGNSRQGEAYVATTSKAKAAEAFGVSAYHMSQYGSEGGGEHGSKAALAQPGVVLICERPYGGAEAERIFVTADDLDARWKGRQNG